MTGLRDRRFVEFPPLSDAGREMVLANKKLCWWVIRRYFGRVPARYRTVANIRRRKRKKWAWLEVSP